MCGDIGRLVGNQTKQASHLHQRRSKFSGGDHVASRVAGEENEKGPV